MTGLLADYNVVGHLNRLIAVLTASEFAEEWSRLGLVIETFQRLGLSSETSDREIWELCQARGLILVTANRNADGSDSLEAAIRDGTSTDFPVITLADARRILVDTSYAEYVSLGLLDCLLDLTDRPDSILGTGRLYLPKIPFTP